MSNIAIIPARGGSKRIPRKNIKDFSGKPIIAYSIEAALQTGLFAEVMVSTDDEEIEMIAKNFGATIPFVRSAKNADDHATTVDVLDEVIKNMHWLKKNLNMAVAFTPTAAFITADKLKQGYTLLTEKKFDAVVPVVAYSYPIWRSLKKEEAKIEMSWPENISKRSQDFPSAYHDAGQFYWFSINALQRNKSLFTNNTGAIELSETEVQDIDNLSDWQLAEFKYSYLHKK